MVIVRRGSERVIGERAEGVSDLNVIGISFKDEGNGDGRSLGQVEDGGLAGGSVGIGGRANDGEDAVVGRGRLDPLGVIRIESGDESGSIAVTTVDDGVSQLDAGATVYKTNYLGTLCCVWTTAEIMSSLLCCFGRLFNNNYFLWIFLLDA
jgi:hypothetical protein